MSLFFKNLLLPLLSILCFPSILSAQSRSDLSYRFTEKGLTKTKVIDGTEKQITIFKPIIVFKGKYEVLTSSGDQRFSLRNSRVGFDGAINERFQYRFMVDLSNKGSFNVLDLFFKYKVSPRLSFTFGQAGLPIFNSYTISPNALDFANRQFIGKFFNSSRDIGLTAQYMIKKDGFPISADLGIYNGKGINSAEFTKTPAFAARLAFGNAVKGFRTSVKCMRIKLSDEKDHYIFGYDIRYSRSNYKFETEVMNMYNDFNEMNLLSYYGQFLYCFPISKSNLLTGIEPALRWEQIGEDVASNGFGVSRITTGINFNLKTDLFKTVFRINYEYFINSRSMVNLSKIEDRSDKITFELMFAF